MPNPTDAISAKMYFDFAMKHPNSVDRLIQQTKDIIQSEQVRLAALEKAKLQIISLQLRLEDAPRILQGLEPVDPRD